MPSDDRSDTQLIKQTAQGDSEAFETLVRRYQNTAWRIAYQYAGNHADAEEIAQDAFLRVLAAAPRYRPDAKFSTFLYRIVVNLCIDHSRKRRPETTADVPERPGNEPTGTTVQEKKDREEMIQKALDALNEQQRLIIVLRYYEELPLAEIADTMNTSRKGIERRLARARRQLAKLLSKEDV